MLGTFVGSIPVFNAAVGATKVTIKAAKGQLVALSLLNTNAAVAYVQCFNKLAANVTVGTTAPDFVIPIGASASLAVPFPIPIDFSTGLVIAVTTAPTGNTGGAVDVLAVIQ